MFDVFPHCVTPVDVHLLLSDVAGLIVLGASSRDVQV